MWKCPICKTDNKDNRICVKCGFDESANYLHYKTIGQVPVEIAEEFAKEIQEYSLVIVCEDAEYKTLKKVNCIHCDNEWYVEESKKGQVKACPFCKKEIPVKKVFEKIDSLDKALHTVIVNEGKHIVKKPEVLSGYLLNIAPQLEKEIKILTRILTEEYALLWLEAFKQDEKQQADTFVKLQNLFVEEEGVSEKWAATLVSGLKGAVLYSKGIESNRDNLLINAEDDENVVKLTYKECSRLKGLSRNSTTRFDVPEGYTHIMRSGLAPYRWEITVLGIPESVRYIDEEALFGCRFLEKIIVHPKNQYFVIVNGALYDRETDQRLWPIRNRRN